MGSGKEFLSRVKRKVSNQATEYFAASLRKHAKETLSETRVAIARRILKLFPTKLNQEGFDTLAAVDALQQQGYGVLVVYTHPSESDHMRTLATMVAGMDSVARRRIFTPIALHQYKRMKLFAEITGVEMKPLATAHSLERLKDKAPPKEERKSMMREYVEAAKDVLREGGTVILAPQGGREPVLEPFRKDPVRRLIDPESDRKIVLLFAGIEIPGVEDYSSKKVKGYNIGDEYRLHLRHFTLDELLERNGVGLEGVDQAAYNELLRLVPEAYIPKHLDELTF